MSLPPDRCAEVQRSMDQIARRLLAERLDRDRDALVDRDHDGDRPERDPDQASGRAPRGTDR